MSMIEVENLTKIYKVGETEVHALDGVSLQIDGQHGIRQLAPNLGHIDIHPEVRLLAGGRRRLGHAPK